MERTITRGAWMAAAVVVVGCSALAGGVTDDYGFDWATIGDVGNAGYDGPVGNQDIRGRGAIDYTYRLSRFEVTTAQYTAFYNVMAQSMSPFDAGLNEPTRWGASWDYNNGDPFYFVPPGNERLPVGGISWYYAAMYSNWLHNGQQNDPSTLMYGAYDATAFFDNDVTNDPVTHEPGAKYWIPTLDEWIKAVHYDPTKDGVGGWWLYPDQSDTPLAPGLPGEPGAQTSAGVGTFSNPSDGWDYDMGQYPANGYYGIYDASGGAPEWLEEIQHYVDPFDADRWYAPSAIGNELTQDRIYKTGALGPGWPALGSVGLRIASAVPTGGTVAFCFVASCTAYPRRKRTCCFHESRQDYSES